MDGVGPPLVTPFTEDGEIDDQALRTLVGQIEDRGVDFLVPCGSNSEAELMRTEERRRVIEIVAEESSVPVLAGTGNPGYQETLALTRDAATAGADAALVVTPFYYHHDQSTLAAYYKDLADAAPLPVYLYSVPAYTGVRLDPETVGELATHPNIAGIKDSSGDIDAFIRIVNRTTDTAFDPMVGSGGVLSQALGAGASGGVLALANIAPSDTAAIYREQQTDPEQARQHNAELVELNTAITATYGIPGLKYAMRQRGFNAGYPRRPHQAPAPAAKEHLDSLIATLE